MISIVMLIVGCSKHDSDSKLRYVPNLDTPRMATLAYFTGTSLSYYFNTNLSDMEEAVANGSLGDYGGLMVLWVSSSSTAELIRLAQCGDECYKEVIKEYEDFASLSKESVEMVLRDTKEALGFYDAELSFTPQLNMIISGHGTGWVPYDVSGVFSSAKGVSYSSPDSIWESDNPSIITRYMGSSNDGKMNISDLAEGIEASETTLGYMLFDACLMANIETLYRLRDITEYVVASPAEIMGPGFPYSVTIPNLFVDNGTAFDLPAVCEDYYNYYLTEASYKYATVSYCVTSELEPLAQQICDLPNDVEPDSSSLQYYEGLSSHIYYDLKQYIELSNPTTDTSSFEQQFDRAFPEDGRYHTTYFYTSLGGGGTKKINSYGGVSTSAPSQYSAYMQYWDDEPWSQAISK